MSEENLQSMDSQALLDTNDGNVSDTDNDTDFVPPSSQVKSRKATQRKSTAGSRKIQHEWKDDEVVRLIAAVEKYRALWDAGSADYKLPKIDLWHAVANEVGNNVDTGEVKIKWASLRVTFKVNLSKLRDKKSGQGTSDSSIVTWKYFNQMMFVEANDVRQSAISTSSMDLVISIFTNYVI